MRRDEEYNVGKRDEDGCGGEEKEMTTEPEMDRRVNVDLREKGLSGEKTRNRAVWRQLVRNIDPSSQRGGGTGPCPPPKLLVNVFSPINLRCYVILVCK